jgi:hypothetical protein
MWKWILPRHIFVDPQKASTVCNDPHPQPITPRWHPFLYYAKNVDPATRQVPYFFFNFSPFLFPSLENARVHLQLSFFQFRLTVTCIFEFKWVVNPQDGLAPRYGSISVFRRWCCCKSTLPLRDW